MHLSSRERFLIFGYFLFLMVLLILRAVDVPLTPDEAFSYFLYVEPGYFTEPQAQVDANNHLLNSFLSWCSTQFFSHDTLFLRLANILAFPIFFFSNLGIARQKNNKLHFWIALITLNSVYAIFEFFSLSRGYGLSFAFLSLAIYQLFLFQKDFKSIRYLWILLALGLGLLSQLGLFFAFSSIVVASFLIYTQHKTKNLVSNIVFGAYACLSVLIIAGFLNHLLYLNNLGMLYYGDSTDFPLYNISTVMDSVFHSSSAVFSWLFLGILVLTILAFTYSLLKRRAQLFINSEFVFPFIFTACIIGILSGIFFFDTPGPIDRTALYLVYLLVGSLFFFPIHAFRIHKATLFAALLFPISFLIHIRIQSVHYWEHNAIDKEIYTLINAEVRNNYSIAGSRYLDRVFHAEQHIFRESSIKMYHISDGRSVPSDLLLLSPTDFEKFPHLDEYTVLWKGRKKGVVLLEKIKKSLLVPIVSSSHTENSGNNEFIGISTISMDSLNHNHLHLQLALDFSFQNSGADFLWTTSFVDSTGRGIDTRYTSLNQFKRNWRNDEVFHFDYPIFEIPEKTAEIRIYIYNPKRINYAKLHAESSLSYYNEL